MSPFNSLSVTSILIVSGPQSAQRASPVIAMGRLEYSQMTKIQGAKVTPIPY